MKLTLQLVVVVLNAQTKLHDNCSNLFPAGEANFVQDNFYVSVPRKVTPGHLGWIWFVQSPSLMFLAVHWSDPATLAQQLEFVKVCWFHFASWESFIGFYIWCYPISTTLACLFTVGVQILWKKLSWKGSMVAKMPSRASYLVYYNVWRVNLSNLSQKFVWALMTTTPNCRVSFLDFNLVFPKKF